VSTSLQARLRTARLVVLLLAPAALLAATGILGVGRSQSYWRSGWDMHFLYTAGRAWLDGLSPYDPDVLAGVAAGVRGVYAGQLRRSGFAYMPQVFPLCAALSALPLRRATVLMTLVNLAAVGVVIAGCVRLATPRSRAAALPPPPGAEPWAFVAPVVLASPFTSQVLWLGQTSLLATALVLAAWCLLRQGREAWAGVLMALASGKIQLALLPLAWCALERRGRLLVVSLAAALAMMAVPIHVSGGPLALASEWLNAIETYRSNPYVSPGFRHTFSLQALLASAGIHVPGPALLPAAAPAILLLWAKRREL
jgi:hypothetical protein